MCTPGPFSREIGSMFGLDWQLYHASLKATPLGRDTMARFSDNGHRILNPTASDSHGLIAGHLNGK